MTAEPETLKRNRSEETDTETGRSDDEGNTSAEGNEEIIDVDFEFFEFKKAIDYHAVKRLISVIFQDEAENLTPGHYADMIIENTDYGTTVKCDGVESDPYAMMTMVPLIKDQNGTVKNFIISKCQKHAPEDVQQKVKSVLNEKKVLWWLNERLINMPVDIAGPMAKMLKEELEKAKIEADYVVYIAKTYLEHSAASEEAPVSSIAKKKKKPKKALNDEFFANQEDELIEKYADFFFRYDPVVNRTSDVMNVFHDCGLDLGRKVFFLKHDNWKKLAMDIFAFASNK
jgi:protein BCP1